MGLSRRLVLMGLVLLALLVVASRTVSAHNEDKKGGMVKPKTNATHDDDDDDDDDDAGMKKMGGGSVSPEEQRRKQEFMLVAHALIATGIVWITLPISVALVSGKKMEMHRNLTSANTLGLLFVGLIAILGFADGFSWHSKIAFMCLGAWVGQAGYGWVRHYFFKTSMSIKPHRTFGVLLVVITIIAWVSGVLHVMGSCNAPEDIQMCNAHFYLGAIFVLIGLVNGYYAPEYAAKVEMCLIAFGGFSELIGEGVVDSILNAIDPQTFVWNSMAKATHLSAASAWILSAIVGWIIAVRRPLSLERGIGLCMGTVFHLIFMFSHGGNSSPKTQAAHLVHELALIPMLFTRPTAMLPKITSYLLTVSGFAFIMAADPITRDVGDDVSPFAYVVLIILFASIFHGVHGYIRAKILKKTPSETMLERTGWAQPVYCLIGCLGRFCCCCCPGLTGVIVSDGEVTKINAGNKYQHLETQAVMEEEQKLKEMDEDVTSAPPV